MAQTVEQVARDVLASIDSDASITLAAQWVSARIRQVASRTRLRALRKIGTLRTPAPITGTASVTAGSTKATLSADPGPVIGWHIRIAETWYEVVDQTDAELTLEVGYGSATNATASFRLQLRFHALPADVRHLGSVVHQRRWRPLRRVSLGEIDHQAPSRRLFGRPPWCYVEATPHVSGHKRLELYPYSDDVEIIHYVYWSDPPRLQLHEELPVDMPDHAIKEGVLIDLFRYEAGRQAKLGNIDAAAYYRNEARAQKTQWDNKDIVEAIRGDTGVDDIVFIAERAGAASIMGEIDTAFEQVWSG